MDHDADERRLRPALPVRPELAAARMIRSEAGTACHGIQMSKIAARSFKGGQVKLDGTHFDGCEFDGCTLIYSGGELPQFSSCTFANVQFGLDGAAARTASYMRMTYKAGASAAVREWMPELFRTRTQHLGTT